jgi:uncharacterized protein VirK/YbjX
MPAALLPRVRLMLGRALAIPALCREIYPESGWQERLWRAWLGAVMLRRFALHQALLDFFEADPVLHQILLQQPYLLRKVHRAYPYHGLNPHQRGAWLFSHYRLMLQLLGPALTRAAVLEDQAIVCRVALPEGRGLLPVLLRPAIQKHQREGDLLLELRDPFGTKLYALTFSFEATPSGPGVFIGALQGQLVDVDLARHLTKLSLGVRPVNLMLFVLQTLAQQWGAQHIRATGRERHIHAGSDKAKRVHFDYDAFWQTIGGTPDGDGFFQLPLVPQRRSLEDIPSNKRSQYRRRYAWLDSLAADIQNYLHEQARQIPQEGVAQTPGC